MRRRIIVDARKCFDSGIGTYIRNVVPRVLVRIPECDASVCVSSGEEVRSRDWIDLPIATVAATRLKPFSILEQLRWDSSLAEPCAITWCTSLAHPIGRSGNLVATVHDVAQLALPSHGMRAIITKLIAKIYLWDIKKRAKLILFNSHFTEVEFGKFVGVPKGRTAVTQLGVDRSWFQISGKSALVEGPYFICIGNIKPHKNLACAVNAFIRLGERIPHRLLIVGQLRGLRTQDKHLLDLVQSAGSRIQYAGFVSEGELKALVKNASGLIFPSFYEGWGLPALEAMAAGCPVFAARAGALPEVCGGAAIYFNPASPETLALAISDYLLMDDEIKARALSAARARALGFNWDKTADVTAEHIVRQFDLRALHD